MIRRGTRVVGGEALVVFASATLAAAWMSWSELPGRSGLIPLTWVLASWLPMARGGSPAVDLGLARSSLLRGLKYFVVSTAILLPLGVVAFALYLSTGLPMPAPEPLPDVTFGEWTLYQIAIVAPAEELFFRGYLQGRLEQLGGRARLREAAAFWLPIAGSALFFGLAHVAVTRELEGFGVVLPGLLFAWLRARSGSLVAPMLSHGTANVVTRLLLLHAGAR